MIATGSQIHSARYISHRQRCLFLYPEPSYTSDYAARGPTLMGTIQQLGNSHRDDITERDGGPHGLICSTRMSSFIT